MKAIKRWLAFLVCVCVVLSACESAEIQINRGMEELAGAIVVYEYSIARLKENGKKYKALLEKIASGTVLSSDDFSFITDDDSWFFAAKPLEDYEPSEIVEKLDSYRIIKFSERRNAVANLFGAIAESKEAREQINGKSDKFMLKYKKELRDWDTLLSEWASWYEEALAQMLAWFEDGDNDERIETDEDLVWLYSR